MPSEEEQANLSHQCSRIETITAIRTKVENLEARDEVLKKMIGR